MTALRETFEETGLLLTTTAPPASLNLRAMQSAVYANAAIFEEQLASAGLRLVDATLLTPATTWITPLTNPRRFKSRFFIASLPEWMSEREAEEVARRGDGGKEVVSALFVTPRRALAMAAAGEVVFFPPQFYLLSVLAQFLSDSSGDRAREERRKLKEWADMGWGSLVCQPQRMKVGGESKMWVMTLGDNGDKEWAIALEEGEAGEPKAVRLVKREEALAKI
jgi:8-oxo-dGTP pyrophosphatase MutT (NUDIX family)